MSRPYGRRPSGLPQPQLPSSSVLLASGTRLVMLAGSLFVPLAFIPGLPTARTALDHRTAALELLLGLGLALGALIWVRQAFDRQARQQLEPTNSDENFPSFRPLLFACGAFVAWRLIAHGIASGARTRGLVQHWAVGLGLPALPIVCWMAARQSPSWVFASRWAVMWLLALAASGGALAAHACGQALGIDPLASIVRFTATIEGRSRVVSVFGNPEYLGGYFAPLATALAVWAWWPRGDSGHGTSWPRWHPFVLSALAVALLAGCVASATRGALLGAAFGGTVLAVAAWRLGVRNPNGNGAARPRKPRLVLVLAATLAALSAFALSPAGKRFSELANLRSDSVRERLLMTSAAGRMLAERPWFGGGLGAFPFQLHTTLAAAEAQDGEGQWAAAAHDLRERVADHVHHDYLEVGVDSGWPGLLLFGAVHGALWAHFAGRLRRRPPMPPAAAAAFAGYAAFALNALFSFPFHMPDRGWLAWSFISIYMLAAHSHAAPQPAAAPAHD